MTHRRTQVSDATDAALRALAAAGVSTSRPPALLPGVANVVLGFADIGLVAKVAVRPRFLALVHMEHAIASELTALGAPVASPHAGVGPVLDKTTGYLVTLWNRVDHDPTHADPDDAVVDSLRLLHEALDHTTTAVPSFLDELLSAREALDREGFMTALPEDDLRFIREVYDGELDALASHEVELHRLHGEPHAANRLSTSSGVVWVDFESCCTGPREWDLTFMAPESVRDHDVDPALLACLRTLNRARFATWRWGIVADHPELRALAVDDLAYLRTVRT